jgi:uncharacterized membrane protein YfcA
MLAQRVWALVGLLLGLAGLAVAVLTIVTHFPLAVVVIACLAGSVALAWTAVRHRGLERTIFLAFAVVSVAGSFVLAILRHALLEDLVVLVVIAVASLAARQAFRVHLKLPAAPRPRRPVLFYNPRSGGGKAARFHLPEEARQRGIVPVELKAGDDLEQLVREAVASGADGLAMAGGDGSQAIAAMVAAEMKLPYACIPAGTRNHFALDLGVDRDDVVGALDAFVDGGEKRVDLAEVNGRVFVNNVSLGLYAEAVQRPGYREAKLHTLLETVPDVLGPDSPEPDLVWNGPSGPESAAAILVSNNPYRLGRVLASGTRPLLNCGVLGIAGLIPTTLPAGTPGQWSLRMEQWTSGAFEVRSRASVPAGVDGEALRFAPPLRFSTRPRALRVRIAPRHPGASPSAVLPTKPARMVGALSTLALRGRFTNGALG